MTKTVQYAVPRGTETFASPAFRRACAIPIRSRRAMISIHLSPWEAFLFAAIWYWRVTAPVLMLCAWVGWKYRARPAGKAGFVISLCMLAALTWFAGGGKAYDNYMYERRTSAAWREAESLDPEALAKCLMDCDVAGHLWASEHYLEWYATLKAPTPRQKWIAFTAYFWRTSSPPRNATPGSPEALALASAFAILNDPDIWNYKPEPDDPFYRYHLRNLTHEAIVNWIVAANAPPSTQSYRARDEFDCKRELWTKGPWNDLRRQAISEDRICDEALSDWWSK